MDPIKDGFNWYGYVEGDPINNLDIDGQRKIIILPDTHYSVNDNNLYVDLGALFTAYGLQYKLSGSSNHTTFKSVADEFKMAATNSSFGSWGNYIIKGGDSNYLDMNGALNTSVTQFQKLKCGFSDIFTTPMAMVFKNSYNNIFTINNYTEKIIPLLKSYKEFRSAEAYNLVIDQFKVDRVNEDDNKRYSKIKSNTYCNIFMWDVTVAMNAEIPHVINGREYLINETIPYIEAGNWGWEEVSAEQSQERANNGYPTIATLRTNTSHGHTAVVRPMKDGDIFDPKEGPFIAQAGYKNINYTTTKNGFGNLLNVKFFTHE